ncbi:taste receptor type 1 member 3-like [Pelobates fuscus]|uniref:taste receptor type 1 member 3-like n=1 Tax=Pelobates fuscus TaxID=191477 RepID=UPI002FE4CFE7
MKFAVDEINNSSSLLPCTRLGYEIYDICNTPVVAVQGALRFLSERNGSTLQVLCNYMNYSTRVIAVIGPSTSEMVVSTGKLFSYFYLPQISFEVSSEKFNDKATFRSFFRTVPSDFLFAQGIVKLMKEFQWNWIALVGSSDDYGIQGTLEFANQAFKNSICIAYQAYIPKDTNYSAINGSLHEIISGIKQSKVNVTVMITSLHETQIFLNNAIQCQLRMVWIASTSWSLSQTIHQLPGIENIGTFIGFAVKSNILPGFDDYVRNQLSLIQQGSLLRNATSPKQNIGQQVLSEVPDLQEKCNECTLLSPENITEILSADSLNLAYRVYVAVYSIGNALHYILNGSDSNCSNSTSKIFPHQLLKKIQTQSFNLNGESFSFDPYGNPNTGYDIVTWRFSGRSSYLIVGDFQQQLNIRRSMIGWYSTKIPKSTCSRECSAGQIKITEGFHTCCFECLTCPEGTYANASECSPCPPGEWSKAGSKTCQFPTFHFLTWGNYYVIGILILMAVIMFLIFGVALLLLKYQNTPIVSVTGRSMCGVIMLGLVCICLSIFFYIGQPNELMCHLQQPFLSISFTVFLGPIVVKSIKLVVFPSDKSCLHWLLNRGCWIIISCSFLGQLLLCALYIFSAAPFSVASIEVEAMEIYLSCQYEPVLQFSLMFGYNGLLVLVSFVCSFMAETPINQYNSARDITFSMLTMILAWIIFIPTYVSTPAAYKPLIQMVFILGSCLGILAALFFPKCYIVLYRKELNINEYFGICNEKNNFENNAK